MNKPLSPSDIEVLIYCHVTPEPHPRKDAPAVRKALEGFLLEGLIEKDRVKPEVYTTTPLGNAHIKAICKVAVPRVVYLDEKGEILE